MQLYYKSYGTGHPLIILHGLLGASGNWHTLASKVFGEQYHVFTVDLRNHGRSPHSDVFDYPAMVADLVEFMDQHSLSSAYVLGHSMGGKVAMHLALDYPERVDKLVVVDIAPKAYPPYHQEILDALRALDLQEYGSRGEIDVALAARIESKPVRQFLLKNLQYDGNGGYRWQMHLEGIYRNYDQINKGIEAGTEYLGPTLFIRGGASSYVRDDDLPYIRELFPAAELVTIKGAGHWVHAEKPDDLAESVLRFLGT